MKIDEIEGIGASYAEKLKLSGITSVKKMLEAGASKKGRKELSNNSGINEKLILKWVNLCDLCRIKGVSTQYSELLESSGVDTVNELKGRNAKNLSEKMLEVNKEKKLVRVVPGFKSIEKWVEQAKTLPAVITY